MTRNFFIAKQMLIAIAMLVVSNVVTAEIVIVVHPDNELDSGSKELITKLFLGKSGRFPNGKQAIPIDQAEGAVPREVFYSQVVNKTASQLNAYWSRLIFTGKGQPPKAVEDDEEVMELVAENPNFIGYLDASFVDSSVKVLLSIP